MGQALELVNVRGQSINHWLNKPLKLKGNLNQRETRLNWLMVIQLDRGIFVPVVI